MRTNTEKTNKQRLLYFYSDDIPQTEEIFIITLSILFFHFTILLFKKKYD